jgi:hypothetical protein
MNTSGHCRLVVSGAFRHQQQESGECRAGIDPDRPDAVWCLRGAVQGRPGLLQPVSA